MEFLTTAEDILQELRQLEVQVNHGAEAQRQTIDQELSHLCDLVKTKRQQLLSKSALEEKQKCSQLNETVSREQVSHGTAQQLLMRSEYLLSLESGHTFLSVVLPLITDMKRCTSRPHETLPNLGAFRHFATDAQVRCLGDLELAFPRPQQVGRGGPNMVAQGMPQNQTQPVGQLQSVPPTTPSNGKGGMSIQNQTTLDMTSLPPVLGVAATSKIISSIQTCSPQDGQRVAASQSNATASQPQPKPPGQKQIQQSAQQQNTRPQTPPPAYTQATQGTQVMQAVQPSVGPVRIVYRVQSTQ